MVSHLLKGRYLMTKEAQGHTKDCKCYECWLMEDLEKNQEEERLAKIGAAIEWALKQGFRIRQGNDYWGLEAVVVQYERYGISPPEKEKPLCTTKCINHIQGARSKLCKPLGCELQDENGHMHHEYCRVPSKYREKGEDES